MGYAFVLLLLGYLSIMDGQSGGSVVGLLGSNQRFWCSVGNAVGS